MSVSSYSFSSRWPDPNSLVLSKIDFGVPLVELFKWLDVHDTLRGENFKEQDIKAALALARDCKHPDAVWLTSIFEGKDVSTDDEAREVFLLHQNDARALSFACSLDYDPGDDFPLLRRAAATGNAFACATLCASIWDKNSKEECFRLAQLAALKHERDGFFWMGRCFREGIGCKKDLNLAKKNLLIAAELGDVYAAFFCGNLMDKADPDRWFWRGREALGGSPFSFLDYFSEQVKEFFSGFGNATIVFLIGRALKGNIDVEEKEIFGEVSDVDSRIDPANQAVSFYDSQIKSARLAVDTWTFVASRLHLIKDMRIFIGKMIWGARFEANYMIENDPALLASPHQKRFRK